MYLLVMNFLMVCRCFFKMLMTKKGQLPASKIFRLPQQLILVRQTKANKKNYDLGIFLV